jgi:hypothetical protein
MASWKYAVRKRIRKSRPSDPKLASKQAVLLNLLQALLAIILGNLAYFFLAPAFHLPRHQPFKPDWGLVVDFWFCAVAYGLIRTARKWK